MDKFTNNPLDSILESSTPGTSTVTNNLLISTLETSRKETFRGTNTLAQDLLASTLVTNISVDQMMGTHKEVEGMTDTDLEKDLMTGLGDHKGN